MALTREERKLLHQKGKQPTFGSGKPDKGSGNEGDVAYRKIEGSGTVQYLKQDGDWLALSSSGDKPQTRSQTTTRTIISTSGGVSNHNLLSGLLDDDHTQYTHNTVARTISANHNFTGTPIFSSIDINGGTIDGTNITVGSSKTLDVSGGTLTLSDNQISGDKVESGTINAITITGLTTASITATDNIDIGSYDLRAATLTADGLTETSVVFAGANGVLSDDSDLTFSGDTLTATKIGAFTAAGAINFDNQDMTNVDIDSGAIDGTTIGANSQAAGDFTAIGAVAAGTIVGTTIDATTDFTIDGLVITADTITNDANLTIDGAGDIVLSADGGNITMHDGTLTIFDFDVDNTKLTIHDDQDTGDKVEMTISQHGAFTIASTDDNATAGHITIDADGDIILDPHTDEVKIFRQGNDYGAKLIARDTPDFVIHSGNGNDEGELVLRSEGGAINMASYDASGPTETTRMSFKVDSTPELDATGDFKIDGSGDITLDSVDDFYVITNSNQVIKANTTNNIYFLNYSQTLFRDYFINIKASDRLMTIGSDDFQQNYSLLGNHSVSSAYNTNFGT